MNANIALLSFILAVVILAGCVNETYPVGGDKNAPAQGSGIQVPGNLNTGAEADESSKETSAPEVSATGAFQLEDYNSGIFSITKPVGWEVLTGGTCGSFSFLVRDRQKPLKQIFYYGEMGPVYLNEEQKSIDREYMDMGGYYLFWNDMPVVDPLTPENFIMKFYLISETEVSGKYVVKTPELGNVEIISADASQPIVSGEAKKIRAYFNQNGTAGEGLFYVDVAEILPFSGMPAAGLGYAFSFIGLSAERGKFGEMEKELVKVLESFKLSEDYVSDCKKQQEQQAQNIIKAGSAFSGILEEQ